MHRLSCHSFYSILLTITIDISNLCCRM